MHRTPAGCIPILLNCFMSDLLCAWLWSDKKLPNKPFRNWCFSELEMWSVNEKKVWTCGCCQHAKFDFDYSYIIKENCDNKLFMAGIFTISHQLLLFFSSNKCPYSWPKGLIITRTRNVSLKLKNISKTVRKLGLPSQLPVSTSHYPVWVT